MIDHLKNKIRQKQKTSLILGYGFVLFSLLAFPFASVSREPFSTERIDSLIMRLSVIELEEEKADVFLEISKNYGTFDCNRAREYAQLSFELSKKINHYKGELHAATLIGEIMLCCDVNVVEAMDHFNHAMDMANSMGDVEMAIRILQDIAFANSSIGEFDDAIRFYKRAIHIAQSENNLSQVMSIYGYLGNVYWDKGDTATCFEYYELIYSAESKNNFQTISVSSRFILTEYLRLKENYKQAEQFAMEAKASLASNSSSWLAYWYSLYGRIKLDVGQLDSAIYFGNQGVKIAESQNLNKERLDCYNLLIDAHSITGNYQEKSKNLEKYYGLKNQLFERDRRNSRQLFRNEVDNVIQERESDKTRSELKARQLKSENDELLIWSIATLLFLTIVFLFLLYRRLIKGNKLNRQLEQQRKQLQKLSIVAANIEQMVMIVGSDDRIEWVNSAFEKKFGFLKFESVKQTPHELLGGELTDVNLVKEISRRIFNDKTAFEATLTQYSKSNEPYLTRLHISPILNAEKELERYIVISHDITEEQKVAEELRELSLVASNTTNSIVIFNDKMQVIWVNGSFTEMSGLTADAILGKGPLDIYNGYLLDAKGRKELIGLYENKKPFTLELESANRITNSQYWISMSVTPVFDNNRNLLKYISVATDITDVKNLEEQYSGLVEGSADMIYEIDVNGNFNFVNDRMEKVLGYSKTELKQTQFLKLIPDDHKSRVASFYENQIKTRKSTSYIEFPLITKEKGIIWAGQRARLLLNTLEHPDGFSVITRDITEQKQVEQALKKTYENSNLLSEIGMQITSIHTIPDIITQLYGNLNKLMDANVFGIAIPNKDETELIFPKIIENGEDLTNLKFGLDDNTRLAVLCYKGSREIFIDDFEKEISDYVPDADYVTPVAGEPSFSIIYLPLILKGKTIGVITVQSFYRNAYDQYQVSLVKSLASFVAIAMENASLYEIMEDEIVKRTREVHAQKEELEVNYFNTRLLSEIGQFVSSTLDLDRIFERLYDKVGQLMEADIVAVQIYNEEEGRIHHKYLIEDGKRYKPYSVLIDESDNFVSWCIKNRKEIFINDNEKEYHKYRKEIKLMKGRMSHSLLFYPMIVENKLVGVITIQSFKRNAYQEYHLDIIKTLASYIGTVIDNSQLYQTLEQKVKERTEELEKKNTDITDSINYAKRLQKGILPDRSFMSQLLPESFVYFKPKDIVSGDFYWVDRTPNKILMAVVDCTGHGVPGAMMSIIGRNLLDQAVNEKGITQPSQILNFLQVGLSLAFGQTGERKADLFDGMDLSICCIDMRSNILDFAGANNSLYLVQDDELIVLKGDKVGISAEYEISNSYTNLEIEIQPGDVIYMTSDGFPDQFGGERYKKYTYGRMQKLFLDIHKKEMGEQHDIIKQEIANWKGDKDQIDDICVMGVRIV